MNFTPILIGTASFGESKESTLIIRDTLCVGCCVFTSLFKHDVFPIDPTGAESTTKTKLLLGNFDIINISQYTSLSSTIRIKFELLHPSH